MQGCSRWMPLSSCRASALSSCTPPNRGRSRSRSVRNSRGRFPRSSASVLRPRQLSARRRRPARRRAAGRRREGRHRRAGHADQPIRQRVRAGGRARGALRRRGWVGERPRHPQAVTYRRSTPTRRLWMRVRTMRWAVSTRRASRCSAPSIGRHAMRWPGPGSARSTRAWRRPPAFKAIRSRSRFQRQALSEATEAVRLQPALLDGQIALALAYRGLLMTPEQRAAAERAVALDPRSGEARVLVAELDGIVGRIQLPARFAAGARRATVQGSDPDRSAVRRARVRISRRISGG